MKLGPVSGRPVGKQNWTPESTRVRVDEAKRIIGPDNPYLRSNIVARSHPRAIPVNKLRAYICSSISVYLSSRIRFTNTVYTISLFPLMNNAPFVSFLARIGSRFAIHLYWIPSPTFHSLFRDYWLRPLPNHVFFEAWKRSLSLSFSLRIRTFAYFFSPCCPTPSKIVHVRSPPSISLSLLLRQANAKANAQRTLCIHVSWKHTSVRQCVGA